MSVELITVATSDTPEHLRFIQSCERFGIVPITLQRGTKWQGFSWRFKHVIRTARNLAAEHVIHADGYDTECLEPVAVILAKFLAFGHPWVFSWNRDYLRRPEPYLNLCAGLWMARRDYLTETITDAWLDQFFPDHFNDEHQLQQMLSWRPSLFALDTQSILFFTSPVFNPTGLACSFIHYPDITIPRDATLTTQR